MDGGDVERLGRCNAATKGVQPQATAPKGVSARTNTFFRGDSDNPLTREDERYNLVPQSWMGTGEGSDVSLHFDVDEYRKWKCARGPSSQPDEVLFHELVHALRYMQGNASLVPTENALFDNEEEFLAIVATNVYISAKGGTAFRANHHDFELLRPPLNTSQGFLADRDNLRVMSVHRLLWTDTFNALAMVVAPFNPFRELSRNLAYLGRI
jgi:hypothetical protein